MATEFGVGLSRRFDLQLARHVEELGFHGIWVGGHVLWHTPTLDPLVQLAAYSSVTTRLALGTSVLLLPLYHPVTLAKTVGTLDQVSNGRVILGVGIGGEGRAEFSACGVDHGRRGVITNESIDILRLLWTDGPTQYHGEQFRLDDATMQPLPVQVGGPPIWVGGSSKAALRRVARRADGWLGIFQNADRFRESAEIIRSECETLGREPSTVRLAHYLFCNVSQSEADALDVARRYLERSYARPFSESTVRRYCAVGTTGQCHDAIQEYLSLIHI